MRISSLTATPMVGNSRKVNINKTNNQKGKTEIQPLYRPKAYTPSFGFDGEFVFIVCLIRAVCETGKNILDAMNKQKIANAKKNEELNAGNAENKILGLPEKIEEVTVKSAENGEHSEIVESLSETEEINESAEKNTNPELAVNTEEVIVNSPEDGAKVEEVESVPETENIDSSLEKTQNDDKNGKPLLSFEEMFEILLSDNVPPVDKTKNENKNDKPLLDYKKIYEILLSDDLPPVDKTQNVTENSEIDDESLEGFDFDYSENSDDDDDDDPRIFF